MAAAYTPLKAFLNWFLPISLPVSLRGGRAGPK